MSAHETARPGPADLPGIGLGQAFSALRPTAPPAGWAARALREQNQPQGRDGHPAARRLSVPQTGEPAGTGQEPIGEASGRAGPARREAASVQVLGEDTRPDWQIVIALRATASELITERQEQWEQEHRHPMTPEDRRLMGRSVITRVVHEHADELTRSGQALWPLALERRYVQAVEDAIFGYGRMQPVFDIPDAENIEIHGFDSVVAQFGDGRRRELEPVADSDEELVAAVRFLGENANPPRPFDDAHPTITVAVGDRFRLHAIGFGLADRPSVIIRQHLLTDIGLDQLAAGGLMPREVADLLRRAVLARLSIVISGDQGAGKTTLLRALVDAIPATERFGTLETDYELLTHLQPRRRNMVALQATIGLGEVVDGRRIGEYTVADLIPEALRQNLTRLVVGEVRGDEAGAMLQAMQSGAGALTTTHSHSASATMDRLAARVAAGGVLRLDEAYRQIAYNIHLLVHVQLLDESWRGGGRRRFVGEIRALTGAIENGRPVTHLVYRADRTGAPVVFDPGEELLAELAPFTDAKPSDERGRS
ncbi:CpaF family protein [Propionibacterium australiense]|uniref:Type II secretion system protein E n=1 Tax=Propionibacterium australiense TaxID=119981 RepID=A0A383S6N5_9ACTN|nr:CpaF/VirB11 family protein [Propionibacterium australiense]RLP08502.1 CpaF family protein [Propionibacterium australiense]SYZ33648.1 Type II secretion system protein E [Propionibacterium australiense]VEH88866.1 Pertussis toxin liberation protein H [Propionibacterium australiense]